MIENRYARRKMALSARLAITCTLFSLFSTYSPAGASAQFEKHLEIGKSYLVRQEFDLAIKEFNSALALSPKNASVLVERGTAYNALNKHDLAISDFTGALATDKSNYLAYNNRGVAYWRKSDITRALADFDSAIKIDGKQSIGYLNRLGASLCSRNTREAQLSAAKTSAWLSSGNWRDKYATHAAVLAVLGYKLANQPNEATKLTNITLSKADNLSWPYEFLKYYSGKITLEKLMEEAEKSDYHLTQAQCFLGIERLLKKDLKAANEKFAWVTKYGTQNSVEYSIAKSLVATK
jgi:Lipoprotein NlpI, contains TPR repeats